MSIWKKKKQVLHNPFFIALRDSDPNGPMEVRIDPSQVNDATEAGIILADFAKHFARALHQTEKAPSEGEALTTIQSFFNEEILNSTQNPDGGIQQS